MAYLGNTPTQQAFTPAVDYFSGNGSTTAFTLSRPVASAAQVQATIENVPQNPGTAFTVSGNTITFDGAPPSGTNNIYVYYTSPITQVIQPGQGTVGAAQMTSGAAVTNIGYTPVNKAGDTMTGQLTLQRAGGSAGSGNNLYVNVTSSFGGISVNSTTNNNSFVELLEAGTKVGGFNADTSSNVTSLQSDGGHALAFNTGGTTERGRFDTSGNFQFNSGYGSVATAYGCRAWVNFNGQGTVAIRASGNVSSITDDGVGVFRINFANTLSDANYCITATIGGASSNFLVRDNSDAVTKTTSQFRINCATLSGPADVDPPQVNVAVFR
jgi:hypothetical protein